MKKDFKIYIVHYKELTHRKKIIENSLKLSGIKYYFETDYDRENLKKEDKKKFFGDIKDSYKANFLSHIKCYEHLYNSEDGLALILEDDSVPEKIFFEKIESYLKQLPKDFGLFFVSSGKNKFHIPLYLRKPFKKVYKKNNQPVYWGGAGASRNADAYFISRNCAKILYDEFYNENFKTDTSIDWWLNDMIRKYDIPVYWAEPVLIETNKYESSFK